MGKNLDQILVGVTAVALIGLVVLYPNALVNTLNALGKIVAGGYTVARG